MFDEPVAASLLSYLCRHKKSVAELQGMVAQWVGSRRPRRSEPVPIDVYLRPGGMYQDLLHQINVMPPLFVRGPQPGSITELNLGLAGDDPSSLSVSEMMAGMSMSAAAPPTMPGSGASGSSGGGGV